MKKSRQVKGLPFGAALPEPTLTRTDALDAFYEAGRQMADVPEMTLDEINAEIVAARVERRGGFDLCSN